MRVVYTFEDRVRIEGAIEPDPDTARAIRNARSRSEQHRILDPLIAEHALSDEQAANGSHQRSIDFGLHAGRYDR